MIHKIGESRLDLLKQIGERSNAIKNSSITLSNLYKLNTTLTNALQVKLGASQEKSIKVYLDDTKKNYDIAFHDVGIAYDAVVIGDNGFCYSSQAGDNYDFVSLTNQLWYKTIYNKKDEITFISSFQDVFGMKKDQYIFSAARRILDKDGKELGTLLINIDEQYLSNIYQSSLNGLNRIYIVDSSGNIISHNNKNMRGMNFINVNNFKRLYGENQYHIIKKSKEKYLISNYYDQQTGWTIIEEMPCSYVFSELYRAYYIIFGIVGACFLFALLFSLYVSKRVSKPLLHLCDSMNQVKDGNLDVISYVEGYDEINQLKDSFNSMAQEIKKLLEDIRIKEAYKRRTERALLKSQINPHFLYNTLFSIKCSAELGRKNEVVEMIRAFIDLLKMTYHQDTNFIPLKDEIAITEKYLVLQQIRYRDMLGFEFETDEDTAWCMVPALILQPIVENAIFHGIEAKGEAGFLVISAKIHGDRLMIAVSDDGLGMTEEKQKQLLEQCDKMDLIRNESIGIVNVSNRIKIEFGDEYGLQINSELNIGTTITLELPIIPNQTGGRQH